MKLFGGFLLGVLFTVAVVAGVGYLSVVNGWIPAAGDFGPLPLENWAAHQDLKAAIGAERDTKSPVKVDDAGLMQGAQLYASNCAFCHGTPKVPTPPVSQGLYPSPTLFGLGDLVTDDPEGTTYWKIKHGIKWTGMPGFGKQFKEEDLWKLTAFLKQMDKLPPNVKAYWKDMKPE